MTQKEQRVELSSRLHLTIARFEVNSQLQIHVQQIRYMLQGTTSFINSSMT